MHACACEIFSAILTRALQRFNLTLIQRRLKISKNGASVSCFELSGLLVSRPGQGWNCHGPSMAMDGMPWSLSTGMLLLYEVNFVVREKEVIM